MSENFDDDWFDAWANDPAADWKGRADRLFAFLFPPEFIAEGLRQILDTADTAADPSGRTAPSAPSSGYTDPPAGRDPHSPTR